MLVILVQIVKMLSYNNMNPRAITRQHIFYKPHVNKLNYSKKFNCNYSKKF